jgi:hypothetical protein
MDTQNQIKRTLAQPDAIETIRQLQNDPTHKTRAAFARAVCQTFWLLRCPPAPASRRMRQGIARDGTRWALYATAGE